MGPYRQLRSYKRHEDNKNKIGQERSSMQQANYQRLRPAPWMQERYSFQAFAHESSKVRGEIHDHGERETGQEADIKERQNNKRQTYLGK